MSFVHGKMVRSELCDRILLLGFLHVINFKAGFDLSVITLHFIMLPCGFSLNSAFYGDFYHFVICMYVCICLSIFFIMQCTGMKHSKFVSVTSNIIHIKSQTWKGPNRNFASVVIIFNT